MSNDLPESLPAAEPAAAHAAAERSRRRRLRTIGSAIFAIGVIVAVLTYWIETRNAGPSMDELFPGSAEANARQMGILYGQTWATVLGWMDDLGLPAGQASLIVLGSAIVSALYFHVARLPLETSAPARAKPGTPNE